ncbi:MAG: metallophosphoesterase [Verrucomicrobiae bacterium]|nr:metallophosphoesterase [Verrucomicrobiae bacterium]
MKIKRIIQSIMMNLSLVSGGMAMAQGGAEGGAVTFMFLGDLHLSPELPRNSQVLEDIRQDIKDKKYQVDLVCHTGDLIENQVGNAPAPVADGRKQWEMAVQQVEKTFGCPFFMSLGNHDWYGGDSWFGGKKNVEDVFFPWLSKNLQRRMDKPFYAFRWGTSYFMFLNHFGFDEGWDAEQSKWLEKSLAYAEGSPFIKHVFLFSHPYLWNIDHFRFNEHSNYGESLRRCSKVGAFFCGHSHVNTATVWLTKGKTGLLQISGCPGGKAKSLVGERDGDRRLVLNPPPAKRGYMRRYGHCNGYFLVKVEGKRVTVTFDIIKGAREWEFYWENPGEIVEVKAPVRPPAPNLKEEDLADIKEARLYLLPCTPDVILPKRPEIRIMFNGENAAVLPRGNNWVWGAFAGNPSVSIPSKLVKLKNLVSIPNPQGEAFALRDCCLWIKLKSGKEYLSQVHPRALFSVPWRQMYMDFGLSHPGVGVLGSSVEENLPEELIQCVKPGEPVSFELNFPSSNQEGR